MSDRTFFSLLAAAALATSIVERIVGWSSGAGYAVSMLVMIVVMLICFPRLDPGNGRR